MLGLGTVGAAVAEALLAKADSIAHRVGRPLVLHKALVRDPHRRLDRDHARDGGQAERTSEVELPPLDKRNRA